jgi:ABC-type multidrug transport system fused ATPase/permease subunit
VFTVAHRLQTIVDYDLVIVMEAGSMVEMGSISELMGRRDGWLRSIVEETGGEVEEAFRQRVTRDLLARR